MRASTATSMLDLDRAGRCLDGRLKGPPAILKIFLLFILFALGLAGCMEIRVEVQVTLDVQANGSGTFSVAMGMSRGLRNLLQGRDEDPMLLFTRSLSKEDEVIALRRWDDGNLEWVEGSVPFANLKELNQHMQGNELISDFSLVKQKSLLKDRYVLDAIINPLFEDTGESSIDPSSFLDFQLIVRLPGEVVETNGFYDLSSQGVAWSISGKEHETLHAVSEVQSWGNLGILLWVGSAALSLLLLGSVAVAAVWLKKNRGGSRET